MQTEKEFLSEYKLSDYERPSVTTDIAAFMIRTEKSSNYRHIPKKQLSLLLIKRGGHPYKGMWALPGGFLQPNETVEECALREMEEETQIKPVSIIPVGVFSKPGRDPRGWIISNAFVSIISEESVKQSGSDDAEDAQWFDISFEPDENGLYILTLSYKDTVLKAVLREGKSHLGVTSFEIVDSPTLAFDHAEIIATALSALRFSAKNYEVIFDFLPEEFTLSALQKVQEAITNVAVMSGNFRRIVSVSVEETGGFVHGEGHRPAKLFRRKKKE